MTQKKTRPVKDSFERYLDARNREDQPEKTQAVYYRKVSEEERRKKRIAYMLLVVAVAAIMFATAFVIRSVSENRAYSRYMKAAQISTLEGDYENALSSLRKAAAIDLSDECLLMMAQCYEALGNYERAIEALRSMQSTDAAISAKISSIEAKQKSRDAENLISIAGNTYEITETNLVLDNQNLGNAVLPEVARLYALSNLSMAGNGLTDISALSTLGGLTTLNLSSNSITDLRPLSNLTALRTLYLDSNPITDFTPLYSLTSLTTLSIKGINISETELKNLSNALPSCAINGASTRHEDGTITLGGETFSVDVTVLNLSGKGIVDISALSACQKLTTLNLSGNQISDITPLMDIPGLQVINLSANNVTDLRPLMGLLTIKSLDVSYNAVNSTVSLGSNTSLQELNLANNPISNFSGLAKLKNLSSLNLSSTGFSDEYIDYFSSLSKLIYLNVEYNQGLSGEGYDALQRMIPACNISHSDLIYSITTDSYTISSDATEVDLTGRGISDLSFLTQLDNIVTLRLGSNNISNIYYFQYTDSWQTMRTLDLSNNSISDLTAMMSLTGLVSLNLSYNQITDVSPLFALTNLRELYLTGNPVNQDQIIRLNSALTNCTIYY